MKVLENTIKLMVVLIALIFAYFSTVKLFNINMRFDELLIGLLTYGVYLFTGAMIADSIQEWFKKTHWDKIEKLKKVETK